MSDQEYGKVQTIVSSISNRKGIIEEDEDDKKDGFTYIDEEINSRLDDDAERTVAASQAAVMAVYSSDEDSLKEAGGDAANADPDGYANIYNDLREE